MNKAFLRWRPKSYNQGSLNSGIFFFCYYWGLPYVMQMKLWFWPPTQQGRFPQQSAIAVSEIPSLGAFPGIQIWLWRGWIADCHLKSCICQPVLAVPETDCSWRWTEDIRVPGHPREGEVCHVGMLGQVYLKDLSFLSVGLKCLCKYIQPRWYEGIWMCWDSSCVVSNSAATMLWSSRLTARRLLHVCI